MNQNFCPLYVFEESKSEAETLAGSLDDSGDISHHKAVVIDFYHSEVGIYRGEMIIGYLGLRAGGDGKQRRLSYVWEAYQTHVSYELHLEDYLSFLGFASCFSKIRSLANGILKVDVSSAAAASLGCHKFFSVLGQVFHDQSRLFINYDCTHGYLYDQILSGFSEAVSLHAVLAVFGFIFYLIAEIHQSP